MLPSADDGTILEVVLEQKMVRVSDKGFPRGNRVFSPMPQQVYIVEASRGSDVEAEGQEVAGVDEL